MSFSRLLSGALLLAAASGVITATAGAADEKDVLGAWKLEFNAGDRDRKPTLTVMKGDSGRLEARYEGEEEYSATSVEFKDGTLRFTIESGREGEKTSATFVGKVEGDSIEGEASWEHEGLSGAFPFKGKRAGARAGDADHAIADSPFVRTEDVIYGRKDGMALTLDVFTPTKDANGLGVIFVVSGGWFSAHEMIPLPLVQPLVERGYTVFAVCHGSQPKYSIPEVLQDMHRAVRFIRHHARDYRIDPDRIGIYGGSAGGHLSLMQGAAGDAGDSQAKDPVDRSSSRVQAVACFFPPTDFLNYGKPGEDALGRGVLKDFPAPFDFREQAPGQARFVLVTDEAKRREIGRQISPVTHASADDPPMLIVHGDADALVPIQQAQLMVEALEKSGAEAELVVKPGAGHGWADMPGDVARFADWFDEHLEN